MRLSAKVNLIIIITISCIITTIFFILANRYDKIIKDDLLQTARSFYKNIVITRSWVAQHEGVYVEKTENVKSNPFLINPDIKTVNNKILTLKNPAVVTRELSELSSEMGGKFRFHITSLKPVNPQNAPNEFEKHALLSFKNLKTEKSYLEYSRIEQIENSRYFRYFGPLYTESSCLNCHRTHGYKVGDIRGGISIILPMDSIEKAKIRNYIFMGVAGLVTILTISFLIYLLIHKVIIKPLQKIEDAAKALEQGDYVPLQLKKNDEIGDLANAFQSMQKKIKTSTANLLQSEKKYRTLIDCSAEAVLIINDQGIIVDANNSITKLSQFGVEEIMNQSADMLFASHVEKKLPFENHSEITINVKDGTTKQVEVYVSPDSYKINDEENLRLFYLRDLSEQKRMEKIMIDTEKMFALNQLSSGIAHEIRNPLFSVRNNLNYLNDKFFQNTEFAKVYSEIDTGVKRINKLVNSILDYARPHQPEFKEIHIEEVIERSLELISKQFEKARHTIKINIPDDLPMIELDPHKMEQVFINLSTNSLQAMNEKGIFEISVQLLKKHIKVTVSDNGCGIKKDEISRIFDPFFTRTVNGTGLGLSIIKNIIQQHNGDIRVKSIPDQGTTFVLVLPLIQK
ncbi:hypothetical protein B6I21_06740 [candidate division KSB1 bacterium 4572_119]|nr:MAG: hypothetical protein B6I21_06740 [candidate division KSB1 bacterium 4572_119]